MKQRERERTKGGEERRRVESEGNRERNHVKVDLTMSLRQFIRASIHVPLTLISISGRAGSLSALRRADTELFSLSVKNGSL